MPIARPATTSIVVVEFTLPLVAVTIVWPTCPGVNIPEESIVPELTDQFTTSLITEPEESFTTAVNMTTWSVDTLWLCGSI